MCNIDYVDWLKTEKYIRKYDAHPSAQTNKIIAEFIANYLYLAGLDGYSNYEENNQID